jgi:uncharacterized phiE125 gp8 family phage protein
MALNANAIVTRAAMETYLEIPADSDTERVEALINAISELMERYTGRYFVPRAIASEVHDGNGIQELVLNFAPLVALTTIAVEYNDGTAVTTLVADIRLDKEAGILFNTQLNWVEGFQNIDVGYTAGYGTVGTPAVGDDIKQACKDTVAFYYKRDFIEWTAELKQALINVPSSAFPITALKTLNMYLRKVV